jgi:hypothetical protein
LRDAFLRRCDEPEAVVAVLRLMASTPHGSWSGSRHFGIREFFEEARFRPELPQLAIQEANLALEDIGITSFRITAIAKEAPINPDVDSYVVSLASTRDDKTIDILLRK